METFSSTSLEAGSQPPASKKPNYFYKVVDSCKYLYKNPVTDIALVGMDISKASLSTPTKNPLPSDRESKILGLFWKVYTSATLAFRALNCYTHMLKYQGTLLSQLKGKSLEMPGKALRDTVLDLCNLSSQVAKHSIRCGYHDVVHPLG